MSQTVKAATLLKQAARGQLDPLYAVIGDDDVAKDRVVSALVQSVEPDFRMLNVERLYLRDLPGDVSKAGRIVDAARTLPMMSARRVVIVQDAEKLLAKKDEPAGEEQEEAKAASKPAGRSRGAARKSAASLEHDLLEAYFRDPSPETCLVFVLPPLGERDRGRRPFKVFFERATSVLCLRQAETGEIAALVQAMVSRAGMRIERAAERLLVERAAGDRSRARMETDRACLYAAGREVVTLADVEAIIGSASVTDAWRLVRHMEAGKLAQALGELDMLLAEGGVPVMILGQLRTFVERSLFVPAAVDALLRTDLALKNSGGDSRVLLERLVVELVGLRERAAAGGARRRL